jgi:hypothetical protein
MSAEMPRCALCRTNVQVGQPVTFRADGRVQHTECPKVICPVCSGVIEPDQPIRRDGEQLLHGNCWMRRLRNSIRS